MPKYRVTIHEHNIYDLTVDAIDEDDATNIAENSIMTEDTSDWIEDERAGWYEIGSIYAETTNLP